MISLQGILAYGIGHTGVETHWNMRRIITCQATKHVLTIPTQIHKGCSICFNYNMNTFHLQMPSSYDTLKLKLLSTVTGINNLHFHL